MSTRFFDKKMIICYSAILFVFLMIPLLGSHAISAIGNKDESIHTIIIDAGHGGIDSGAVSCTGIYESNLNLEIALKLEDLMHLLGLKTTMTRTTDCSIHTKGSTIAEKKISDIKERVRISNITPNGILVSIHQNIFSDQRYHGAQVFYNTKSMSKELAESLQKNFRDHLNRNNKRQVKKAQGIYLMEHISCPAVLVECGFLSNAAEEAQLRNSNYQKRICAIIATTISNYLTLDPIL